MTRQVARRGGLENNPPTQSLRGFMSCDFYLKTPPLFLSYAAKLYLIICQAYNTDMDTPEPQLSTPPPLIAPISTKKKNNAWLFILGGILVLSIGCRLAVELVWGWSTYHLLQNIFEISAWISCFLLVFRIIIIDFWGTASQTPIQHTTDATKNRYAWLILTLIGLVLLLIMFFVTQVINSFAIFNPAVSITGLLGIVLFFGGLLFKPFQWLIRRIGHRPQHPKLFYASIVLLIFIGIPIIITSIHDAKINNEDSKPATVELLAPKNSDELYAPVTFTSVVSNTTLDKPASYEIIDSTGKPYYNLVEIPYQGSSVSVNLPPDTYSVSAVAHGSLVAGTAMIKTDPITITVKCPIPGPGVPDYARCHQ